MELTKLFLQLILYGVSICGLMTVVVCIGRIIINKIKKT